MKYQEAEFPKLKFKRVCHILQIHICLVQSDLILQPSFFKLTVELQINNYENQALCASGAITIDPGKKSRYDDDCDVMVRRNWLA